jgi:hypothetical protein
MLLPFIHPQVSDNGFPMDDDVLVGALGHITPHHHVIINIKWYIIDTSKPHSHLNPKLLGFNIFLKASSLHPLDGWMNG